MLRSTTVAAEVNDAHRRNRPPDKRLHSNPALLRTKGFSSATRADCRGLSLLRPPGLVERELHQAVAAAGIPAARDQGTARFPRTLLQTSTPGIGSLATGGTHRQRAACAHRQ